MNPSQDHLHTLLPKSICNRIGPLDHTGQTSDPNQINISVEIDLFNGLINDLDLISFRKEGGEQGETQDRKRVKGVVRKFDPLLPRKDQKNLSSWKVRIADCGVR